MCIDVEVVPALFLASVRMSDVDVSFSKVHPGLAVGIATVAVELNVHVISVYVSSSRGNTERLAKLITKSRPVKGTDLLIP